VVSEANVLDSLSGVRDPELDQSITELGFVSEVGVRGDTVTVRLRLPTYWCAPNFAYLMVEDAKRAVSSISGVVHARVLLDDHFAATDINQGVGAGRQFQEAFAGQAEAGLEELRDLFRRKAFVARQERICRKLLSDGRTLEDLAEMVLDDLAWSPDVETYLRRRAELGIDTSPSAALLVDPSGRPIPREEVSDHLRLARMVGVSVESNAGLCRALLAARYGIADPQEALR
jgi:metal-sulfur cluster biosynthetic enzyme